MIASNPLKPEEWPSKEAHDNVRDAYMKWVQKNYGEEYRFRWSPLELKGPASLVQICDCCGSRCAAPYSDGGHSGPDYIRIFQLKDGTVPNLGGRDHFVIRDKDKGDHVLAWSNA